MKIRTLEQLVVQPGTFVTTNNSSFFEVYQIGGLLGTGSFGEVRKTVHRTSGATHAVKIYRKDLLKSGSKLFQELEFLRILDHPHIIRVYETFEDSRRYYIIMELCRGGELFDELTKQQHFTETQAALIMGQLLSSVAYLHGKGIIHRDLKPENILLEERVDSLHIKLIDFGAATFYKEHSTVSGAQGTAYYVAPEVLSGSYTEKCDLWSCGVILYILLSGSPPFDGQTDQKVLAQVSKGSYAFTGPQWESVSSQAKDLIEQLLCPEPIRLSALRALEHE